MTLPPRLFALIGPIFLTASLLSACSDSTGASNSGPEQPTAGDSGANPPPLADPPGTTATANAKTVEMGIGTYCWTTMCVDKIGPVTKGTLQVSPGDTITIAVPQGTPPLREVHASAYEAGTPALVDNGDEIWSHPPTDSTDLAASTPNPTSIDVEVDLAPGKYVLTIFMAFEPGDVVYGVILEVR
jgi:hypothetical protein